MDVDGFWTLIEAADSPESLQERLAELPDDELLAFERQHAAYMRAAYAWPLWGAAFVINGGCGDDAFEYFRAALISLGQEVFEAANLNPESLAGVTLVDPEEWEDWMSPTAYAIQLKTGEFAFAGPSVVGEPSGTVWDEADLPGLFPRLAEEYGFTG